MGLAIAGAIFSFFAGIMVVMGLSWQVNISLDLVVGGFVAYRCTSRMSSFDLMSPEHHTNCCCREEVPALESGLFSPNILV